MFLNDSVGHREPQASSARLTFPWAVFCSEKWIINSLNVLRLNPCAAVADSDLYRVAVAGGNAQRAALSGHCIFGIQEKVQKYLLQLAGVAMNHWQAIIEVGLDPYM